MRANSPAVRCDNRRCGALTIFGILKYPACIVSVTTTKGITLYLLTDNSTDLTFAELTLGEVIASDITVLALTKKNDRVIDDSFASWITVCYNPNNALHKFAVWTVVARPTGWERYSGDYCATLTEAVACYSERGGK